jgi:hypothetical protein
VHGVDDALVAGAPAEVSGQALADLLVAGFRVVTQQSGDGRHETRCTETTLEAVAFSQRRLNGGEFTVGGSDVFDGGDLLAVDLDREEQAGADGLTVQQHRTGAAGTVFAAQVGAGETAPLAEEVRQRHTRFDEALVVTSVDGYLDKVR